MIEMNYDKKKIVQMNVRIVKCTNECTNLTRWLTSSELFHRHCRKIDFDNR